MPPEENDWKRLARQENRGGKAYISLDNLERLAGDGPLDLDTPIEYSVSVGVSDGRARAFIQLRNVEEDED